MGIKDANNMGAAMAGAAYNTLTTHLQDLNRSPHYYDAIFTGDLGYIGKDIINDLLKKDNLTKGIKVSVVDKKVTLDMHIIVEYGTNITVVCNSIISNVQYQVNKLTGLEVENVNVFVEGFRVQE